MNPSEESGKPNNTESFEEEFARRTEELEKKRQEYYQKRGERLHKSRGEEQLTIYKARAAANADVEKKPRGEGVLRRSARLLRGLNATREEVAASEWYTAERSRAAYEAVFLDAWQPVCDAASNAADAAWNFLSRLGHDFWSILLYIADVLIALWYYLGSAALFVWDLLWDFRLWLEKHKRALFGVFVSGVSAVALGAVLVSSMTAYEYSYHGRTLGVTKTPEAVYDTISALGDKLSEASGADVSLDVERDIEFNKVYGFHQDIDSREDILTVLTYMKDLQVKAFAILIDGQQKVLLEDETTAENILASIKRDFTPVASGVEYTSVEFVEQVEVAEVDALLGDIWNTDDAKSYIETGATNVPDGYVSSPLVTVATTEAVTYTENIDYGTQYISNENLFVDETEVVSAGVYGQNQIVSEVKRINGEEVERKTLSITKISDPVDEIVSVGTMPIPERTGTGTFIYPVNTFTLSSGFGPRWNSMHKGIDLACSTGTRVHASDGGVVTYAGWMGSYGYLVVIDNGGLFSTYYAHNSKLLVSAGDEVYQGQTIALSGSTGRATGPHCHFEIRYKDVPVNPLEYLP